MWNGIRKEDEFPDFFIYLFISKYLNFSSVKNEIFLKAKKKKFKFKIIKVKAIEPPH